MSAKVARSCPLCPAPRRYLYRWNGFDLFRCEGCGTESVHPLPTAGALGAFYQSISAKKMADWRRRLDLVATAFDAYLESFRAATGLDRPARFLDVGGGVGYYARAAADRGIDAWLLDWAADALRFARRTLGLRRAVRADVQHCAAVLTPASFDFVLSRHTIEHMRAPEVFLEHLATVLRPGGVLQIETPNVASREQFRHPGVMHASYRVLRASNPGIGTLRGLACTLAKSMSGVNPPKHLWGFTASGLTALLARHGFEVVAVERAVAGHPEYDPLYFELQRSGDRTPLTWARDLWCRVAAPLFAGRGMNLAITARRLGGTRNAAGNRGAQP